MLFDFFGELTLRHHLTNSPNNVKTHFQPQGLSGFGLTTGDKYQGVGVTSDEFTTKAGGGENTFVNNFRLIGQGPGNNLEIHDNLHLTVDANGDVTADLDHLDITCK